MFIGPHLLLRRSAPSLLVIVLLACCGTDDGLADADVIEAGPIAGHGNCASFRIDYLRASPGRVSPGGAVTLELGVSWTGPGPRLVELRTDGATIPREQFRRVDSSMAYTFTGTVEAAATTVYSAAVASSACLDDEVLAELTVIVDPS